MNVTMRERVPLVLLLVFACLAASAVAACIGAEPVVSERA